MKVGLCLPYMERDYHRKDILDWCRRIDQGPFSSLSCGERITGYTLEMRMLLGAAAAVTERVRIVPSLYVLPMHSAVWAACPTRWRPVCPASSPSVTFAPAP